MKGFAFIGKLMIVIPMAYFGFGHLASANALVGLIPDFLPFPIVWVYVSGLALILAAIAIILGKQAKLAAQLLGLLLVLIAVIVHLPSGLNGDTFELMNFFKNIAIAGGAWYMSAHLSN